MSTELTDQHSDISVDTFSKYYEQSISNNNTNSKHTKELVDILGGIDTILKHYINISKKHDQLLNQEQMKQICDIISTTNSTNFHKHKTHQLILSNELDLDQLEESNKNANTVTYYFHKSDTFLHLIFTDIIADKLIFILFHKLFISSLCIMGSLWSLVTIFFDNMHSVKWFFILETIFQISVIIVLLLIILSSNKKAFFLITKEFDFWIKLYYSMGNMTANAIYINALNFERNRIIYINMSNVLLTLLVILFSIFEAYHVSWKTVTIVGLVISSIITLQALRFTIWYDEPEKYVEIESIGMKIGLLAYFSAAVRILSIFLWKQTIMSAWVRGKSCVSIYETPKLQWVFNETHDNVNEIINVQPLHNQ
eukprot:523095_1